MAKSYYVTEGGLQKLKSQLDDLVAELNESLKKMGMSAGIDNDLRENPEFMYLRTKATYELPKKIEELNNIIKNAVMIETLDSIKYGHPEIVCPGCEVVLRSENGQRRVITILGVEESDPKNCIVSYLTPLAQSLMDLEIGDEVKLPFQGDTIAYEIISINVSSFLNKYLHY